MRQEFVIVHKPWADESSLTKLSLLHHTHGMSHSENFQQLCSKAGLAQLTLWRFACWACPPTNAIRLFATGAFAQVSEMPDHLLTTFIPLYTRPKMVCLSSRKGVGASVMKNCIQKGSSACRFATKKDAHAGHSKMHTLCSTCKN